MEGDEGDFGSSIAGAGMTAQAPPPPGFRGEFHIEIPDPESESGKSTLRVTVPRQFYEDWTAPRLQRELDAWRGYLPTTPEQAEARENALAAYNQYLNIRQAKDEAAKIAKDLVEYYEQFTPKDIPPPDAYRDPNQNVAALDPDIDTDAPDVDIA